MITRIKKDHLRELLPSSLIFEFGALILEIERQGKTLDLLNKEPVGNTADQIHFLPSLGSVACHWWNVPDKHADGIFIRTLANLLRQGMSASIGLQLHQYYKEIKINIPVMEINLVPIVDRLAGPDSPALRQYFDNCVMVCQWLKNRNL